MQSSSDHRGYSSSFVVRLAGQKIVSCHVLKNVVKKTGHLKRHRIQMYTYFYMKHAIGV